jgi:hypothetical protein
VPDFLRVPGGAGAAGAEHGCPIDAGRDPGTAAGPGRPPAVVG